MSAQCCNKESDPSASRSEVTDLVSLIQPSPDFWMSIWYRTHLTVNNENTHSVESGLRMTEMLHCDEPSNNTMPSSLSSIFHHQQTGCDMVSADRPLHRVRGTERTKSPEDCVDLEKQSREHKTKQDAPIKSAENSVPEIKQKCATEKDRRGHAHQTLPSFGGYHMESSDQGRHSFTSLCQWRRRDTGFREKRSRLISSVCSESVGKSSWCWLLMWTWMLLVTHASGQTCSANTGCFTPSVVQLAAAGNPARTVQVNSTCGGGSPTAPELYQSLASNDVTNYTCLTSQHPAAFLTDDVTNEVGRPNLTTYWQSANSVKTAGETPAAQTVVLNFTDVFLVSNILVYFIAPHVPNDAPVVDARPKEMLMEKWDEAINSWVPLRAFAESCAAFPDLPVLQTGTGNPLTAYCTESYYSGHEETAGLGTQLQFVELNVGVYRTQLQTSKEVKQHYMTSALRLTLKKPANQEPLKSYYAIADIIVEGRCECFGHASTCGGQNSATCQCQHFTTGQHCEQCLPLYNDRPWQMGTTTDANACQPCFCNDHATSCHYDDEVGYGVCDDCSNNTSGPNCTQCNSGYYINPHYNASAEDGNLCEGLPCNVYCIDCGCDSAGTQAGQLGVCDAANGQCTCKLNVMGTKCDECKDTYWGLSANNFLGCTLCNCDTAGSLNSTNYCNKTTGACVCKANTEGTRCERCKPETFGFSALKVDGCTECDCDPGGSLDNNCEDTSGLTVVGQCSCRSNIEGRDCRQPVQGYFVPKMDYFLVEAEKGHEQSPDLVERPRHGLPGATCSGRGFVSLLPGGSVVITMDVTFSGAFGLVLRYEKTGVSQNVQVEMSMVSGASYECENQTYTSLSVWRFTGDISQVELRGAAVLGEVCVQEGRQYRISVTTNGVSALLLDSVFLLPKLQELPVFAAARQLDPGVMLQCMQDVLVKFPADRGNCSAVEYSVMAQLLGGAIACACPTLPAGSVCDAFTGDCPCPEGVLPPDCRTCRVDYYDENNYLLDGCTACGCHVGGSVSQMCNDTGVCECRPNVVGLKCAACLPEHYGLQSGKGCTPCQCNRDYSFNNSCADSGQCHCKPGVGGLLCDTCLEGSFNLTTEGCSPCDCDPDGSTTAVCSSTGVCVCKARVTGPKCDQCGDGFYGLGPWHPDGCIACYCTDHSNNCTTADGWFDARVTSDWSLLDSSAVDTPWGGQDGEGNNVTIEQDVEFERSILQAQYVMRLTNSGTNQQYPMLYFFAPPVYLGDKRSAYGRHMWMLLKLSSANDIIADYSGGDVILQGAYSDFQLVYALPYLPVNSTMANYTVTFLETLWHVNTTDGPVATHSQMMATLSNLQSLLIRGKFSNASGATVSLYGVEMAYATRTAPPGNPTPVSNVEQCFCSQPFGGEFCETCAEGFWRDSTLYRPTDTCTACECNGHAGGPCNVTTGVCQCIHNTTGDHCELCLPGYYGNALLGTAGACQPCMCPGSVPDQHENVFASVCELDISGQPQCINCSEGHGGKQCEICVEGYYGMPTNASNAGGACVPCRCNDRAETCDSVTGFCVNCTNNTAGKECEVCASGYYGNAMTYSCRECQCQSAGATGECDPVTGQCVCRPNVMGFFCDLCVPNTYNYTSGNGCMPCDCHPQGALRSSCDLASGQCDCRQNVIGRQCDACADTYWRLNPLTGCDQCLCSQAGTLQVANETFGICDLVTGQCQCAREGIIGRTCDRCSTVSKLSFTYVSLFNIGEYPNCVMCGECFDQWALVIDSIGADMAGLQNRTAAVWAHYGNLEAATVNITLSDMETKIQDASDSVTRVQNITLALSQLAQKLQEVQNKVSQVSLDLQDLQQEYSAVQQNISSLTSLTGLVTIGNGSDVTTASLLRTSITGKVSEGGAAAQLSNTSWQQIQQYSQQLSSVATWSAEFARRRDTAMQLLQVAVRTFDVADNIYNSSFFTGYSNNDQLLNSTQQLLQAISTQLTELEKNLTVVQSEFAAANVSLNSVVQVSNALLLQWRNVRTQLQEISGDVVMATTKVIATNTTVNEFQIRASAAVEKLKAAFEDILEGLIIVQQIQADITTAIATTTNISDIVLRPLSEMQQLAGNISSTVVSSEKVADTNAKAQTALTTAQNVRAEMEQTLSESQGVLEEVTTIQNNIRDANAILTATRQTHTATLGLNNTIHSALEQARTATTQLDSLVTTTTADITTVEGEITQVSQCLQTRRTEASTVQGQADLAFQQAQSALQAQSSLSQVMSEVTAYVTTNVDTPLANIRTASDLLKAVQAELDTVQTPTRVSEVLKTHLEHLSTLETLQSEIRQLEVQLDSLLNTLAMDTASANCRG